MTLLWPLLAAAVIGLALSQQPAINAATATVLGSALIAAAFSLFLSALIALVAGVLTGAPTQPAQLLALPWWAVLGGVFGAMFVAGSTFLVPITGAAMFFTCLVAGQLVGALVIDAVGAFGLEERAISARKVFGVALAFAGVLMVRWG